MLKSGFRLSNTCQVKQCLLREIYSPHNLENGVFYDPKFYCPGVIRTPILEGGGKYGKMLIDIPLDKQRLMWETLKPMSPRIFAGKVLNWVAKNRAVIIVPSWWKFYWWINRVSSSLGMSLAQKSFQKWQKELGITKKNEDFK